jgi:hypothetical protein
VTTVTHANGTADGKPLRTGQLAKLLHVAPGTVAKWANRGELPCERMPGKGERRIYPADAVEFCRRNGWKVPAELLPPVTLYVGCDGSGVRADTALGAAALAAVHRPAAVVIDVGEIGATAALELCRYFQDTPTTVIPTEDDAAGPAFAALGCRVVPPGGQG